MPNEAETSEPEVGQVFFAYPFINSARAYTVGDALYIGEKEVPEEIQKHYPNDSFPLPQDCYTLLTPKGTEVFGFELYFEPKATQDRVIQGRPVTVLNIADYRAGKYDYRTLIQQDVEGA